MIAPPSRPPLNPPVPHTETCPLAGAMAPHLPAVRLEHMTPGKTLMHAPAWPPVKFVTSCCTIPLPQSPGLPPHLNRDHAEQTLLRKLCLASRHSVPRRHHFSYIIKRLFSPDPNVSCSEARADYLASSQLFQQAKGLIRGTQRLDGEHQGVTQWETDCRASRRKVRRSDIVNL